MLHVYLGRFAPFHEGHKILLTKLIKKFGIENCLVLIGSSNVLNERTPFKFGTRRKMVNRLFPNLEILPLPDVRDDEDWLNSLEQLQTKLGKKLVFYGGSIEDLRILSVRFEIHVLIDRFTQGRGINATEIRRKHKENLKIN